MDTHRWHLLKVLLDEALARPPEQRGAFLEAACTEADLRAEAQALLRFYDEDSDFLDAPVRDEVLHLVAARGQVHPAGTLIGPYRLLHEIGRGGMGTVYLAARADGSYTQQVAIKIVGQGTNDLSDRLRHERQVLATLAHPNIARLLDGGVTAEGWPWLAMEYVDGMPVDAYCQGHGLSTEARIGLFQRICEAVQYAHQNLVIHRDLKPSNILVTTDGQVKLLDFGIARLLDATTAEAATRTGRQALTLAYAAPEQMRGTPVTTASDVYSLGMVLYELLTGQRPYELTGLTPTQVERRVCEEIPPRPSAVVGPTSPGTPDRLRRRLEGDLDTIVLMALRKEPGRRYGSAAALAEDLRRHLVHLPVTARPDTLPYRISRFVRRHRMGVAATGLVALTLLGGLVATVWQARVAAAERDRARQRFDDVHVLANTMLFDLHDAIRDLPGTTPVRQTLVAQALTYLDVLAREADDDTTLLRELAEAYERVGEIRGDPHFPNLGDLTGAAEDYGRALALRRQRWQMDTTDATTRRSLANSYGRLAVVRSWGGDNEQALALSQQAITLLAPLDTTDPHVQQDRGRIRSELGWWHIYAMQLDAGMAHLAAAESLLARLAIHHPDHLDVQIDLWRVYAYQSDGLWFGEQLTAALHLLREKALPHTRALANRFPLNPRAQASLQSCLSKIANLYALRGQNAEALAAYQTLLPLARTAVETDPANTRAQGRLASTHHAMGDLLVLLQHPGEAFQHFQQALTLRQALYDRDPRNGEAGYTLASTLRALCYFHRDQGRPAEALRDCLQATDVQQAAIETDPQNAVGQLALNETVVATARLYARQARQAVQPQVRQTHFRTALAWYDRSLAHLRQHAAVGAALKWYIAPETIATEREALALEAGFPTGDPRN